MYPLSSPYFTFKDDEHVYILQRRFPHYLGRIQYTSETDPIIQGQIPMYRIFIVFAGQLDGNRILLNDDWKTQLNNIWESMCKWYREERIETMPERYKKYLI